MSSPRKLVLAIGGACLAVVVVGTVAVLLVVRANAKGHVQALASSALGMEVTVRGKLGMGLFPGPHLSMADVEIRNGGSEVATAAQVRLVVELLPLLHSQVRTHAIVLNHVRIAIERQHDGHFNFETPPNPSGTGSSTDIQSVSISDAAVSFIDKRSGNTFAAQPCTVDVRDLKLSSAGGAASAPSPAYSATVACGEFRAKSMVASDLKFSMEKKGGTVDVKPVTMRAFGGHGSGSIRGDLAGATPRFDIHYELNKFQLAEFFRTMTPREVGVGVLDFAADLSVRGDTADAMIRTANGKAAVRGHDLTLEMGDVDERFSRFESSQNFNLVDVGAFFFAGPLGLVVTKGYNFANIFQGSGGSSHVATLVSEWNVEQGVAQATDVAMATKRNRIALHGGLDFVNGRFKDVTIALVDARGCAQVQQKVSGPFDTPQVEQPSVLKSLTGPARRLLGKAARLLGKQCDVFYSGSVPQPG